MNYLKYLWRTSTFKFLTLYPMSSDHRQVLHGIFKGLIANWGLHFGLCCLIFDNIVIWNQNGPSQWTTTSWLLTCHHVAAQEMRLTYNLCSPKRKSFLTSRLWFLPHRYVTRFRFKLISILYFVLVPQRTRMAVKKGSCCANVRTQRTQAFAATRRAEEPTVSTPGCYTRTQKQKALSLRHGDVSQNNTSESGALVDFSPAFLSSAARRTSATPWSHRLQILVCTYSHTFAIFIYRRNVLLNLMDLSD